MILRKTPAEWSDPGSYEPEQNFCLSPSPARPREGQAVSELGVSRCRLLHVKWINSKVLLYGTGTIFDILE